MLSQIYCNDKVVDFAGATGKCVDPLTAEVLAHNARQVEIALFLRRIVRGVIDWVTAWHRKGVLSRELNALPDNFLKDIGIRRDQIDAVAAGNVVRKTAPKRPAPVVIDDNDIDRPLAA